MPKRRKISAPIRYQRNCAPDWVWSFIGACALIPMIALGGILPVSIGAFGVVGCGAIAHNPNQPKITRVLLCILLTAICWTLFIVLITAMFRVAS